jgi:hypothetical protein
MKDVSNSANIKTKQNIRTYIFKSIMLILKSIKLGFIGFLSLLAWGLHFIGSGIDIFIKMITKKKEK